MLWQSGVNQRPSGEYAANGAYYLMANQGGWNPVIRSGRGDAALRLKSMSCNIGSNAAENSYATVVGTLAGRVRLDGMKAARSGQTLTLVSFDVFHPRRSCMPSSSCASSTRRQPTISVVADCPTWTPSRSGTARGTLADSTTLLSTSSSEAPIGAGRALPICRMGASGVHAVFYGSTF